MKSRASAMLICLFLLPSAALAGDDSRDGVYVRFGLGAGWFDGLELERSDSLLPPYGFFDARDMPLETEEAGLGEAAVGYSFNNYRLEIMFSAEQADVWSRSGGYFGYEPVYYGAVGVGGGSLEDGLEDGNETPDSPPYDGYGGYGGWGSISFEYEELTIQTLSLNGFFDFPSKKGRVVPYVGYGAGAAFVDLPSRHYVYGGPWYDYGGYDYGGPWYDGVPEPADSSDSPEGPTDNGNNGEGGPGPEGRDDRDDPMPTEPGWPWTGGPFEGSRQTDASGASFMYAFYGGVDYRIASDLYLGMRLGYVRIGDVETHLEPAWGVGGYRNPTVEIDGLSRWTAVLTLRLLRL